MASRGRMGFTPRSAEALFGCARGACRGQLAGKVGYLVLDGPCGLRFLAYLYRLYQLFFVAHGRMRSINPHRYLGGESGRQAVWTKRQAPCADFRGRKGPGLQPLRSTTTSQHTEQLPAGLETKQYPPNKT